MFKPVNSQIDFPAMERDLLKNWYEKGIVSSYLHKNDASAKKFSFLDGPITANNPMGVHHAWGRTYKDFWQRYWNMRGHRERFQNGFDEQGLWVEVEVEKELGLTSKKDIENLVPGDKFKSLEKFINLCKERVRKFSSIQTEQSKRLGYFMDWDNSYHTSSDENNYAIWNFIKVVNEKGWLYKGRDSVPWCPRCGTAISQHEILTEEYKVITHRTIVFKLPIKNREKEYLLAWTTTPWTIPGNVALAVDPELTYWKMKNSQGEIIYLVDPTKKHITPGEKTLIEKFKLTEGFEKVEELKGKDLVGLEYTAPYDALPAVKKSLGDYMHRVVASDPRILPIAAHEGTGIVHVAPGAGTEDFQLGKKEKLPPVALVDESGIFLDGFDFISGLPVKEASKAILADLEKNNLAFKIPDYTHRYPTCWRCKTELIWRVVDEWYIAMDKADDTGKTYREQMIEVAKKITWMPEWGLDRELDWLKNMHDWLISKKRYWGLALPIWECKKCNSYIVIGGKEELEKKAQEGLEIFKGNSPHRPWIDAITINCEKCGEQVSRIADVGNPWLDAGIVPFSTMSPEWFPADFITESFPGQFKNWFYSLIAMSTALKNEPSFKRVLGFGSVRDEKGEEMHKSKGNSIEFNEAADKIGVDVMRWLYLRTNPEHNVNFGTHVADEIRRMFHIRLWNIYSFFVTNAAVDGWEPKKSDTISKNILDKWILSRMHGNIKNMKEAIEKYEAFIAVGNAEIFIINDLSNWYVRRIRDRVGPVAENGEDKNSAYETLWRVLTEYSKVLAPFVPFIADEIYANLTNEKSVHLAEWPQFDEQLIDDNLEQQMQLGMDLASGIHGFRKINGLKVRIPLKEIEYKGSKIEQEILKVVCEETNVYKIVQSKTADVFEIAGDTTEANQDLAAGEARDLIRKIQEERKKIGTELTEKIDVELETWPEQFTEHIMKKALVRNLKKAPEFKVIRLNQ